ncbi:MAG: hypothetical protein RJB38_1130 [Pseudomonadota bacterium]|jgi:hypothetical protein
MRKNPPEILTHQRQEFLRSEQVRPRTRVIFLTLFSLPALASKLAVAESSCSQQFQKLSRSSPKKPAIERTATESAFDRYQESLSAPVGDLRDIPTFNSASTRLNQLIEDFSRLFPDFPKADYQQHLRERWAQGAYPQAEESWASFLRRSYAEFLIPFDRESQTLSKNSTLWAQELDQQARKCAQRSECLNQVGDRWKSTQRIRQLIAGSCLAQSPHALEALRRELVMNWSILAGFYLTMTDRSIEEFPLAFLINSPLWSVFFAEKHCRNAAAAALRLPFGQHLDHLPQRIALRSTKAALQEELSDWLWLPLMASSSIAISMAVDPLQGRPDQGEKYYQARWSYLLLYNAASGPIRRVLVLDPVFKKLFPSLAPVIQRWIGEKKVAEVVTRSTEWGVDYGLRFGEWVLWGVLYDEFMKAQGVSDPSSR